MKTQPTQWYAPGRARGLHTGLLLLLVLSVSVRAQFSYVTNNGTITITGYNDSRRVVNIPDAINGLPVKSIGEDAFRDSYGLTSVTIPDGVTYIEGSAFNSCIGLTSITMPKSVTWIGEDAFIGCTSLRSVTIPEGVNEISDRTFDGCISLNSVTIPSSVTTIGNQAFCGCNGLTSLTIPNSVTNVGAYAFSSCWSLTSVQIPAALTSIAASTFSGCENLTNIAISESVTSIAEKAFSGCKSLTSITIPKNVSSLGEEAFGGCVGATAITVDALNKTYSSFDGVLFDKPQATLIQYPGAKARSYTIPDCVTNIGSRAFSGYANLTNIIIPNTVSEIGDSAFQGCSGLTSIIIPTGVRKIGPRAFGWCFNLTNITIPDSVTTIEESAFEGCDRLTNIIIPRGLSNIGPRAFRRCLNLTNITIPETVTTIGDWAFWECEALSTITIPSSVTSIGRDAFSGCTSLIEIRVNPFNNAYSSVDGVLFNKEQNILVQYPLSRTGGYTIPNGVTDIKEAFSGGTGITSITIPSSVRTIGDSAFCGCTNLSSITIPESVTSIGYLAFYRCTSLTNILIPRNVTNVNTRAFCACANLKAITVDAANNCYSSIDGVLFDKNQGNLIQYPAGKAGNYSIPEGVTNIEADAFFSCGNVTSVAIPRSVARIGDAPSLWPWNPFCGCTSLTAITVDDLNNTYSSVDGVLFDKSQNTLLSYPPVRVGSYSVPNNVTIIGYSAFSGCRGLTSVTMADSVTLIDWCAFANCTGLTEMTFGKNTKNISFAAFGNCSNLTTVTIPDGIITMDSTAFDACSSLIRVFFLGDAPSWPLGPIPYDTDKAIVYYLPGTSGWTSSFCGWPTTIWKPQMQTSPATFGMATNGFDFTIKWASGRTVVVEACTDLANPVWVPVGTNMLSSDSSYFRDTGWTNSPGRFYRLRAP